MPYIVANIIKISLEGNKITEIESDFYELFNWVKEIIHKNTENSCDNNDEIRNNDCKNAR